MSTEVTQRRNATGMNLSISVGPRIPDAVWEVADEDAAELGLYLSVWLRQCLDAYLDQDRVVLVPGTKGASVRKVTMDPALWERVKARAVDDQMTQGEVVCAALAWAHELRNREKARSRKTPAPSWDQ